MKKVIISGANGFLGSSLLKILLDHGTQVIAIDLMFTSERVPNNPLVSQIVSSLSDAKELLRIIPRDEYDAFYHFAWRGVNGIEKGDPLIQTENIRTALICAQVAKELKCRKFLCAGTIAERAVESLPNLNKTSGGMMYGVAKHCSHIMLETYCKNIDLPFVWMQFSNIYGPSNKTGNLVSYTIGELRKGNEATFGPALQTYDFILVDDLIEAVLRLGEKDTKKSCYFIGSGTPRDLKDYLKEIGSIFGREDLIKLGIRPDDGIKYTIDMFNTSPLKEDIGEYITKSFSDGIKYTLENLR